MEGRECGGGRPLSPLSKLHRKNHINSLWCLTLGRREGVFTQPNFDCFHLSKCPIIRIQ